MQGAGCRVHGAGCRVQGAGFTGSVPPTQRQQRQSSDLLQSSDSTMDLSPPDANVRTGREGPAIHPTPSQ